MPENNDRDPEASLGDQSTFQGKAKPKMEDRETKSLGDQATFAGGHAPANPKSLGDHVTFGGGADQEHFYDDGMEIVDLAARYKIEKTLGKGGMGEVLLATDTRLNRKVAIKRILGKAVASKTAVNRFLTEAKSIAALNHPNVVQIYDYGRAADGPFLIMEYVDGNYTDGSVTDPEGPEEGVLRVSRGGCWISEATSCRSAYRNWNPPGLRVGNLGFRVALSSPSGIPGSP